MLFVRKASWLALAVLSTVVIVPSTVAANVSIEPRLEDPVTGIMTLIVTNFGTDLMLISLAVYFAFSALKNRVGDISEDPGIFVASTVAASALVAVAGGVIDFAFLYEEADGHYVLKDLSARVMLPAAILIFATIAVSLCGVVRIHPAVSVLVAAPVAAVSPIGWWFMDTARAWGPGLCGIFFMVLAAAVALVVLLGLHSLHRRLSSRGTERAYEGGGA